jgi:hypothetical protein
VQTPEPEDVILYAFIPKPALPADTEGRRVALALKRALRDKVDGFGLELVDYGTAADLIRHGIVTTAPGRGARA